MKEFKGSYWWMFEFFYFINNRMFMVINIYVRFFITYFNYSSLLELACSKTSLYSRFSCKRYVVKCNYYYIKKYIVLFFTLERINKTVLLEFLTDCFFLSFFSNPRDGQCGVRNFCSDLFLYFHARAVNLVNILRNRKRTNSFLTGIIYTNLSQSNEETNEKTGLFLIFT